MKTIRVKIISLLFLAVVPTLAQVDTAAVKQKHQQAQGSFDVIVNRFVKFFDTPKKLVYKYQHQKSKTGFAAYIIEYACHEVNYAVNTTGSGDATHSGTITLLLTKRTNQKCGNVADVTIFGPPAGWGTVEEAVQNNKSLCFRSNMKAVKNKVRMNFEFKEGKWIYQSAVHERTKKPEGALSAAFGRPVEPAVAATEPGAQALNQQWIALVQ